MQIALSHRYTESLPGDPDHSRAPRIVEGAAFSYVDPDPVSHPHLLAWSDALGDSLGISRPTAEDDTWLQILSGNARWPGTTPYANCYGGHQFGQWAGQLGDGRAITLGEFINADGAVVELQLKGAGRTPYSRGADGRAVLRSSLREYLCSEAMHALGVPTTRALSLVGTGDDVIRDMFYDGNPQAEPGAIVCRVAPSFIRLGTFELPASRGDHALLKRLVDYTIRHHEPDIDHRDPDALFRWYEAVCRRTAQLVAEWTRVGFVHGVMNTDNLSVHGITIDYGPYGWLEPYDPGWTPNTTDAHSRRYCFGRQPAIAQWNLSRFGGALARLTEDTDRLEQALNGYADEYERASRAMFAGKLGLPDLATESRQHLLADLLELLTLTETDYTLFFRCLGQVSTAAEPAGDPREGFLPAYYDEQALRGEAGEALIRWLERYRTEARQRPDAERMAAMCSTNPLYVPRNYLAQLAIDQAEQGDTEELRRLLQVLAQPYSEQAGMERYAARRPEWARHRAGCSALSCSS